ncbi:kinase domain protein (macronuclear) [Tetrahymena thermophila SB210]|uniref:Kinase domain protein n=1 Tax=Tetrahymena thermophila (strain SB210) TaxID=312017 RepID=Q229J8_TETTS|nr:kinase domain protein [Tetrahymena thermophila SB210]EAR81963.1 kinase domain protein [Tetrahymena thermophila SB210]|eukprot:XP_001029626.1 kinase domain protein [Tetrahymena thermophila SB210]
MDTRFPDCQQEGINIISKALQNCLNITTLKLRLGNYKIDLLTQKFANTLKNLLNLESLNINLSENEIKAEGAKNISFILQKCQKLKSLTLDLEQFQILNKLSKEGGTYIAQGLQSCSNINFMNLSLNMNLFKRFLNISSNEMGLKKGKDVKSITDSLQLCQNITNLSLDLGCEIYLEIT